MGQLCHALPYQQSHTDSVSESTHSPQGIQTQGVRQRILPTPVIKKAVPAPPAGFSSHRPGVHVPSALLTQSRRLSPAPTPAWTRPAACIPRPSLSALLQAARLRWIEPSRGPHLSPPRQTAPASRPPASLRPWHLLSSCLGHLPAATQDSPRLWLSEDSWDPLCRGDLTPPYRALSDLQACLSC